jgi:hypothetical protein
MYYMPCPSHPPTLDHSNCQQCSYKLYLNTNRKLTLTSFFNIIALLFNALGALLHKLPYAPPKRTFLAEQLAMHAPLPSLLGPR